MPASAQRAAFDNHVVQVGSKKQIILSGQLLVLQIKHPGGTAHVRIRADPQSRAHRGIDTHVDGNFLCGVGILQDGTFGRDREGYYA
jgi:hypothetical protein